MVLRIIDPKWSLVGPIDHEYVPCTDCNTFETDIAEAKSTIKAYFTKKATECGETYEEYCRRRFGSLNGKDKT
jgi:hypothetical protein